MIIKHVFEYNFNLHLGNRAMYGKSETVCVYVLLMQFHRHFLSAVIMDPWQFGPPRIYCSLLCLKQSIGLPW